MSQRGILANVDGRAGKVGAGDTALTAKEKTIHEKGLVGVLKQLHEELDAAVLDAYGWHDKPSDETLLERLVLLNAERAAEEAQGTIRWLRPEFQSPEYAAGPVEATPMAGEAMQPPQRTRVKGAALPPPSVAPSAPLPPSAPTPESARPGPAPAARQPWPPTLPEQMAAVARVLAEAAVPLMQDDLVARFTGKGPWKKRLPEILAALAALAALGRAREVESGRWLG